MNQPLVSVVMPVYNATRYLAEAVESILNQSYSYFEFIIVDDGSSDNSYEMLKAYATKDGRIKLYRNLKNLGIAATRNYGLSMAIGTYYAPMDADDVSHLQRLEKEVSFLEQNQEYVVVGSDINIVNQTSEVIGYRKYPKTSNEIEETLPRRSPFAQSATLIRLSSLEEDRCYRINFSGSEDYELWCRLSQKGKMHNLNELLLNYRFHPAQNKSARLKKTLRDTIKIQEIYFTKSLFKNPKNFVYHECLKCLLKIPDILIIKLFMLLEYKTRPS